MKWLIDFFKSLFEPIPDPLEEKRRKGRERLMELMSMPEEERNMMLLAHPETGAVYTRDGNVLYKENGKIKKVTQSEYEKGRVICPCKKSKRSKSKRRSNGSSGSVTAAHILDE